MRSSHFYIGSFSAFQSITLSKTMPEPLLNVRGQDISLWIYVYVDMFI